MQIKFTMKEKQQRNALEGEVSTLQKQLRDEGANSTNKQKEIRELMLRLESAPKETEVSSLQDEVVALKKQLQQVRNEENTLMLLGKIS